MQGVSPDLLQATLDAERLRNARSLLALRAAVTVAFLVWSLAAGLGAGVPGARARLPILAAYCAVALALYVAGRHRREIGRRSWLAIAALDIPMVYAFQRFAIHGSPDRAPLVGAMTVAICLLLLMAAQLSIRRGYLLLSAATAYGMLLVLFVAAPGVPRTVWLDALLLIGAATVIGTHLATRNVALLETLAEQHQEVVSLNQDLERKVADRTAELERALRELRDAQAQAVHAEKMASIGRLASGIAHEINNPINFIANALGPLQRAFADLRALLVLHEAGHHEKAARQAEDAGVQASMADAEAVFGTLRRGVQRTREIVSGLTAFARRDESEPLRDDDVGGLLDEAVALMRYELVPRIEVVRRYCSEGRLRCYPGALVQLFVNLLSNAALAIEGKGTITLTTARDSETLTVSVADTGAGIGPDLLPKIFEPFFTTRDVGRGSGLGLSIAHGIVERHRGRIHVDSGPARGTRFDISLPLRPD